MISTVLSKNNGKHLGIRGRRYHAGFKASCLLHIQLLLLKTDKPIEKGSTGLLPSTCWLQPSKSQIPATPFDMSTVNFFSVTVYCQPRSFCFLFFASLTLKLSADHNSCNLTEHTIALLFSIHRFIIDNVDLIRWTFYPYLKFWSNNNSKVTEHRIHGRNFEFYESNLSLKDNTATRSKHCGKTFCNIHLVICYLLVERLFINTYCCTPTTALEN